MHCSRETVDHVGDIIQSNNERTRLTQKTNRK